MLFYYGYNPFSTPSMFPVGSIFAELQNEVELYIVDSIGDYMKVLYTVTVGVLFCKMTVGTHPITEGKHNLQDDQ